MDVSWSFIIQSLKPLQWTLGRNWPCWLGSSYVFSIDIHRTLHGGGAGPLLPKSSDVLILEFTLSCDPILLNVVGTCCLTSDNRTWPNQRDVTSVIWWIKILSSWLLANSSSWLLCFPEESWHAGETHGAEDRGLLGSSKDLDGDKITKLRSGSFFSQDGDECSPLLIDPKTEDSALLNLDLWSRETMGCNIITT